jgi:hypothetical protein
MTRLALWQALGAEPQVFEPMIVDAYEFNADRDWRENRGATSFYVSNFPGDDEVCDRAAMYSLMGIPSEKPFDTEGQRWVDAGKALELEFIRRLSARGMLLSGDESIGEKQVKFMDPDVWSSGNVDAIVLPPFWRKSHVVEIKNPGAEKVVAMRQDRAQTPFSHHKYEKQVKTYIGYAHEQEYAPVVTVCTSSWALCKPIMGAPYCPVHRSFCETETFQLEPPDDGTLIYASRDPERGRKLDVVSYYFSYDAQFMAAGTAQLARQRKFFEDGVLPPHVYGGKGWSKGLCRFCSFKKEACRPDEVAKTQVIADSKAFDFADQVFEDYDYATQRARVFGRWHLEDPLAQEATVAA